MKQRKIRSIEAKMIKTKPAAMALAAVLLAAGIFGTGSFEAWATPTYGICISDEVSVREEPVDGSRVDYIYEGQEVEILDEEEGSDGYIWYQVTYEIDDVVYEGWMRSDFLDTSDTDDSEDTDDEEEEEEEAEAAEDALSFVTYAGTVVLEDVPEDVAALVSDRFVSAELTLSAGTVTAYQLLVADDLVSDGAAILDFYYVYGTDEAGESGWYVYDEEQGTLQRSTLNMEYTIESGSTAATISFHGFEFTYNLATLLVMGVLAVLFVVFFVLTIANGARCRRLKKALRKAGNKPSAPVSVPQSDKPAASGRPRGAKAEAEPEEEEFDFPLDEEEEQELESRSTRAGKSDPFIQASGGSYADESSGQEVDALFHDTPVSQEPKDELEELERILSRELMSRDWETSSGRSQKNSSGESQSDDDDIEFL